MAQLSLREDLDVHWIVTLGFSNEPVALSEERAEHLVASESILTRYLNVIHSNHSKIR